MDNGTYVERSFEHVNGNEHERWRLYSRVPVGGFMLVRQGPRNGFKPLHLENSGYSGEFMVVQDDHPTIYQVSFWGLPSRSEPQRWRGFAGKSQRSQNRLNMLEWSRSSGSCWRGTDPNKAQHRQIVCPVSASDSTMQKRLWTTYRFQGSSNASKLPW